MNDDAPKRPNILFLMTDQHRADFVGYEGHVVRTPTLDRIAAEGVQFRSAYTPSPVCVPGRQAMMAGQLPRTCGCENFHGDLTPNYMTFAKRFSQYAYHTACCGKLHHNGTDQMQGWIARIGEETHIGAKNVDGRVEEEFERYPRKKKDYGPLQSAQRGGRGENLIEMVDAYTTQGALNFIKLFYDKPHVPATDRQPLLLKVSLIAPHDPFVTQSDSYDYYYENVNPFPVEAPLPELAAQWPEPFDEEKVSLEQRRAAMAGYCGMIEECDKQFRQVLDALEAAGQDLDDWIIVYTSDHGEMMGQHNLWWKFRFLEGSARVPLLIRAPRLFEGGRTAQENVNLCDLFATLCEAAGIPTPEGLDSRSLLGLCRGDAEHWNNESVSEIGGTLMIKQDALKYIFLPEDDVEILFDLAKDPDEHTNAASDPAYAAPMAAFRHRRSELGYGPDADPNYVNAGYDTA